MVINSSYHDYGGGDMNLCIGLSYLKYIHTYTLEHVQTEQGVCQCQCSGVETVLQLQRCHH